MAEFNEVAVWLRDKHHIDLTGVLHIGANTGQEAADYDGAGCKVIWVEGDPEVFAKLCPAVAAYPRQQACCCLCSDADGQTVQFHVAPNGGGSSSILPPNESVFATFGVKMVATRELTTCRLDTYFAKHEVSLDGFNLINIDVQGFELSALRGLGELIERFDAIMAELNWGQAYHGATRPDMLEAYLVQHGFQRAWLSVGYPQGYGIWVKGRAMSWKRLYMAASIRFISIIAGSRLFRIIEGTKLYPLMGWTYRRLQGRRG